MKADLIKYLRKINKKPSVQGKLLEQFISHGASTIPEMSKAIGVSLPTTTSALNELIKEGLAREIGKKDNSSGRIPMVYDLVPTAGYFIGVNPEMNCLALAASDFAGNLITEKTRVPYVYENSPENLEEISRIINEFIESLPVSREEILQVCVNVAERVNPVQGNAYNMFTFLKESLTDKLTQLIQLPVCIENDTRSMAFAELIKGQCRPERRHLRERMLGHRNRNHHRRQTLLRQVGIFWRIRSHDCLQQQHHLPLRQDWLHRNRSFGQSTQKETHREDKGRKDFHPL